MATEGKQLALLGMARAAQHAEDVNPGWNDSAYNALLVVAAKGEPFMTNDVRAYLTEIGEPDAPEPRAWGAVVRKAATAGQIRPHGMSGTKRAAGHNGPRTVWVRAS